MTRTTYTTAEVRARDLREDDVILVVPGEDNFDAPTWRDVMDVWREGDMDVAEEKYTYADGIRDDDKIEFIREHLADHLGSYVLVRYHVETPGAAEVESELIALRACDLVTVQQPENSTPSDGSHWDNNIQGLRGWVTSLPQRARETVGNALAEVAKTGQEADILHIARAEVADRYPDRAGLGVLFPATDYDGAHYVNDSGTVLFVDGTTDAMDFGTRMNELLAQRYGKVPRGFVVVVNLPDGEIAAADHGDDFDIRTFFSQTPPHDND